MLKQGRQTIAVRECDDQEELKEQIRFFRHGTVPSDLIRPLLRKYSAARAEKGVGQNPPLFLVTTGRFAASRCNPCCRHLWPLGCLSWKHNAQRWRMHSGRCAAQGAAS